MKTRIRNFYIVIFISLNLSFLLYLSTANQGIEPVCSDQPRKYHDLAIGIKTGKDVVYKRPLIQLLTFLKDAQNVLLFGEVGMRVGDHEVVDVVSREQHKITKRQDSIPRNSSSSGDVTQDTVTFLYKRDKEEVVVNGDSEGWKMDAEKNIPSYVHLYNKFPHANWFILIDDDTYLFLENLKEYLSKWDHTKPYYFGNPSMFVGCAGVSNFGEGPEFAHGGSGIIISRGALEKMIPVASECINKYTDCFWGDVRLALCLRDVNVFLQGTGKNYLEPPNDLHTFQSPCETPISFHHLTVPQIQKLHTIDGGKKVRNEDIVPWFFNGGMVENTDRKGHDYQEFDTAEPAECQRRCETDGSCVAYVHVGGRCYLKDRIPSTVEAKGAFSGVVVSHYKCNK